MESGERELIFVAITMAVLFVFAVGASLLFLRQWRREKGQKRK